MGVLSPRPPTGARVTRKQRSAPEGDRSESSESVSENLFHSLLCEVSLVVPEKS